MANLIETTAISGFKVYGQQMVDYTVQGETHQNFAKAVAVAAFAQSSAIEKEALAFNEVIRARQRKLEEMGDAVAKLARDIANMDADSPESDDTYPDDNGYDPELRSIKAVLERYGVSLPLDDRTIPIVFDIVIRICCVTRADAERAKANAEYAMDKEDNDLQQDMVTLQGLISKRDQAYSTAAKIVKKFDSTGDSIISSLGQ